MVMKTVCMLLFKYDFHDNSKLRELLILQFIQASLFKLS